jgi:hypothetical protein
LDHRDHHGVPGAGDSAYSAGYNIGGADKALGIAFAAGGNETVELGSVKRLTAGITGFGQGDMIDLPRAYRTAF